MGQNRKKLPCPKIRIFVYQFWGMAIFAVLTHFLAPMGPHRFRPKFDLWVMAPNHRREVLGSILGPMGSHWGKKLGQNPKKLPCPKIGFFGYPTVIDFGQNLTKSWWGPPRVHLGANGVPLEQENGLKP